MSQPPSSKQYSTKGVAFLHGSFWQVICRPRQLLCFCNELLLADHLPYERAFEAAAEAGPDDRPPIESIDTTG
jgi:hypothetical protein